MKRRLVHAAHDKTEQTTQRKRGRFAFICDMYGKYTRAVFSAHQDIMHTVNECFSLKLALYY